MNFRSALCGSCLLLCGGLFGCSHAEPPLPPLAAESTIQHEFWRVSGLEYHGALREGDDYYEFVYSPTNRTDPSADPEIGRVPAADFLGRAPAGRDLDQETILVRSGAIAPVQPEISVGDETPMQSRAASQSDGYPARFSNLN